MTPDYLESKAVELIYQAQQAIQLNLSDQEYDSRIEQAMSLLALAMAKRHVKREGVSAPKVRKRGAIKTEGTEEGAGSNNSG